jgi:16S rRNA (adenine1518-N6/adenine1519-N6)-dimethyltransferase
MTRQKLGQHFLSDPGWREKIARAIRVSPHGTHRPTSEEKDYCWVDIGAGHGEMTEHLLKSGAPVIAVELDAALVPRLQKISESQPHLKVVWGDVLQTNFARLAEGRRLRIYGNLPYYITSPILHHLFEYADQIDEIHIVIQLEVAQRLTARAGNKLYGYLSVATQFYTHPEFALRLPRGAFRPPPEVGSALISLRLPGGRAKLGIADERAFMEFVKNCFGQKRKTLSNNLRELASPARVREILRDLKLREDARAEQLTVAEFAALYQAISSAPKEAGPDNHS